MNCFATFQANLLLEWVTVLPRAVIGVRAEGIGEPVPTSDAKLLFVGRFLKWKSV